MRELELLVARCRKRDELVRRSSAPVPGSAGVRALFCGPSGTGKTLAARAVAGELGTDLYRVDLSRVVDKYIGETEKNLARVFDRAEQADVVLLLDEGDALLTQRTAVTTSTDRYANLETNYLLARLETFRGVLIVTTNAADRIDGAFRRRMDLVVDFPAPAAPARMRIWRRTCPTATPSPAPCCRTSRPRARCTARRSARRPSTRCCSRSPTAARCATSTSPRRYGASTARPARSARSPGCRRDARRARLPPSRPASARARRPPRRSRAREARAPPSGRALHALRHARRAAARPRSAAALRDRRRGCAHAALARARRPAAAGDPRAARARPRRRPRRAARPHRRARARRGAAPRGARVHGRPADLPRRARDGPRRRADRARGRARRPAAGGARRPALGGPLALEREAAAAGRTVAGGGTHAHRRPRPGRPPAARGRGRGLVRAQDHGPRQGQRAVARPDHREGPHALAPRAGDRRPAGARRRRHGAGARGDRGDRRGQGARRARWSPGWWRSAASSPRATARGWRRPPTRS